MRWNPTSRTPSFSAAALLLATGLLGGGCPPREPVEWTTSSDAAREELILGVKDRMRFYESDAFEHFRRALELDQDFVSAKVQLLGGTDGAEALALVRDIRNADLDRLSERERFLAGFLLARFEGDMHKAQKIIGEYLKQNPNDPFALDLQGRHAYGAGDLDQAEEILQRLLKVEPNWVQAQNLLGYIAMGRGEFREAEERFCSYAYIAPDQANPHDSRGELLLIVGRYDAARREFEKALELRPDFTPSLVNLAYLDFLVGNFAGAEATLQRGLDSGILQPKDERIARCTLEMWRLRTQGDFEGAWHAGRKCPEAASEVTLIQLKSALATGRWQQAEELVERIRKGDGDLQDESPFYLRFRKAVVFQAKGIYAEARGNFREAIQLYRQADEAIGYRNRIFATLKLTNLASLERLERLVGDTEAADATLRRLEKVNPKFLELFQKVPPPPWLQLTDAQLRARLAKEPACPACPTPAF